ncbi:AAA family ATPase [Sphingobacterium paucimobilis]|uniref:ATPase AAA-type core domain-containing protein n=1 Tax=Sphingobacterium paucimobilis HER1398 TaxID=1346330 RepID=U2HC59_9SPHI|nr:ATP-binding protein [Sphingobacterium paucimobilis]ERJ59341.1 hypothetical protein M472_11210 [Sphingobacterium paucimobilis HER1398]
MANNTSSSLYLKQVHIEGFRSISNLNVGFEKGLNILIGKNGSGKSNLLRILKEGMRFNGLPDDAMLKHLSLELQAIDKQDLFEVDYIRKSVDEEDFELDPTKKFYFKRTYKLNRRELSPITRKRTNSKTKEVVNMLSTRNRLYNYVLREHSLSFPDCILLEYNIPNTSEYFNTSGKIVLDFDLYMLHHASSLDFIDDLFFRLEQTLLDIYDDDGDESLQRVEERLTVELIKSKLVFSEELIDALNKYTPIENVRFNPNINIYQDGEQFTIDNIRLEFYVNGGWYPWSHLSDGTKRLFYIIAQVQGLDEGIVLLEEPELGIHPHQFYLLMQFLLEKSDTNQIILSTHSPLTLDHIEPNELNRIQIVSYTREKGTQVRRLTQEEQEKARLYTEEVGYLSDYWVHSDLEE